jgi:hypothetical protein
LVAGYLWLFAAWLIVKPDVNTRPREGLAQTVYDLGHDMGHVALAVAVGFVAYLVGAASQTLSEFIEGRVARLPAEPPGGRAIEEIRGEAVARWENAQIGREVTPDEAQYPNAVGSIARRAMQEAAEEVNLPGILLVGEKPSLFAEVDRIRAEAELRLAVFPPLVALVAIASVRGSLWWLFGLLFVFVVLLDGLDKAAKSRKLIIDAINGGVINSPATERFRAWVHSQSG